MPQSSPLAATGSRTPGSRCFVEDKSPPCQLSSTRLDDDWRSDIFVLYILTSVHPIFQNFACYGSYFSRMACGAAAGWVGYDSQHQSH